MCHTANLKASNQVEDNLLVYFIKLKLQQRAFIKVPSLLFRCLCDEIATLLFDIMTHDCYVLPNYTRFISH